MVFGIGIGVVIGRLEDVTHRLATGGPKEVLGVHHGLELVHGHGHAPRVQQRRLLLNVVPRLVELGVQGHTLDASRLMM